MSERSIRFGVTDHKGRRTATWKCWTQVGSGKKDVYITCRELRGCPKASFHESGHWQVAYDANQFPALFEQGSEPASRFAVKWDKPAPLVPGLTLACRVHAPWYAATFPVKTLDGNVSWIQAPPPGQSIEVAVLLSEGDLHEGDWPGRRSMNTSLVGSIPLDGGGHVWIVHRCVPYVEPSLPPAPPPKYFRGKGEEQLYEKGTRAVTWGVGPGGSVDFFEGPALVRKNSLEDREMADSRRIAGLLGPTLIALILSENEFVNPHLYDSQIPPVVYLSGTLLFVAGLATVRVHNRWRGGWPVLVTLMGWFAIVLGLVRMFTPGLYQHGAQANTTALLGMGIVLLAIGIFLTFKAYSRATRPKQDQE